ncbi:hypothetical protein V5E97_28205 [Singulisphaera sp. Ch08]|uniref:Uncharacterized protein n=1 Tax=Singulisphaera sp. Ch08 TaxID=3120278 RepID=A0AAU7CAP2_9BACT
MARKTYNDEFKPQAAKLVTEQVPVHRQSRPLTVSDLGLGEGVVERLAGRVYVRGQQMTVRVENIRIAEGIQGQQSLASMINNLRTIARQGDMNRLFIERVSVGNVRLAQVRTRRFGGIITPQRNSVINEPPE